MILSIFDGDASTIRQQCAAKRNMVRQIIGSLVTQALVSRKLLA